MKAIDKFVKWNLPPFKSMHLFDRKLVEAILIVLVVPKDLSEFVVHDDIVTFINGNTANIYILIKFQ